MFPDDGLMRSAPAVVAEPAVRKAGGGEDLLVASDTISQKEFLAYLRELFGRKRDGERDADPSMPRTRTLPPEWRLGDRCGQRSS